MLIGSISPFLA